MVSRSGWLQVTTSPKCRFNKQLSQQLKYPHHHQQLKYGFHSTRQTSFDISVHYRTLFVHIFDHVLLFIFEQ